MKNDNEYFFYNKTKFLSNRQNLIVKELENRGIKAGIKEYYP